MRTTSVLMAATLFACSGETGTPSPPSSCDRAARAGTYLVTLTERNGTCGTVEARLISFDPAAVPGDVGCTLSVDKWSEGDCKNERTFTCTIQGQNGPVTNNSTSVTRATTADAARIEGIVTTSIESSSDFCNSTYDYLAVRQ